MLQRIVAKVLACGVFFLLLIYELCYAWHPDPGDMSNIPVLSHQNAEASPLLLYPSSINGSSSIRAIPVAEPAFSQERTEYPLIITRIWMGPCIKQGRDRIFPLNLSIKKTNYSSPLQGVVLFDARRMNALQSSFTVADSTIVSFALTAANLRIVTGNRAGLACFVNGIQCEMKKLTITPQMILKSLFESVDLPVEGLVLKKLYEDLQENEYWYTLLSGKKLALDVKTATDCFTAALAENWQEMLQKMQVSLVQLSESCAVFKQDTLYLIGRPFLNEIKAVPDQIAFEKEPFLYQWYGEIPESRFVQNNVHLLAQNSGEHSHWGKFIQTAMREKRLDVVGGMWGDPDLSRLSGESVVRQILFGKKYLRRTFNFGCRTAFARQGVVQLPQILTKSGFTFLAMPAWPDSHFTQLPSHLMKWAAPDGSTILTAIVADFERGFTLQQAADCYLAQKKQGSTMIPILCDMSDSSSIDLLGLMEKASSLMAFPVLRFNDLTGFINNLANKSTLIPPYTTDCSLQNKEYVSTDAVFIQTMRRCEAELLDAEFWAAISENNCKSQLSSTWQLLLQNQSTVSQISLDGRNNYQHVHENLQSVQNSAQSIRDGSLSHLAQRIAIKGKGQPIVVFNSLAWQRDGAVTIKLKNSDPVKDVKDAEGRSISFQQNSDTLLFTTAAVPAFGFKTYYLHTGSAKPVQAAVRATEQVLENEFFRFEINPGSGNIQRFFDKRVGYELLRLGQVGNQITFSAKRKDIPCPEEQIYQCDQVESISILENGPARAVVRYVRKGGDLRIVQDYILAANSPRLDIRLTINQGEQNGLVQSVWPFATLPDTAVCGAAFGAHIKAICSPLEEKNLRQSALDYVSLTQNQSAIVFLRSGYLTFSCTDRGLIFDVSDVDTFPDKNRTANMVPENSLVCNYSIVPYNGSISRSDPIRFAAEYNRPLIGLIAESHSGILPVEHSFFTIDKNNVIVSAIKNADEGDGMVIRMFEAEGQSGRVSLFVDKKSKAVYEVNLLEENIRPIEMENKLIELNFKPYEIITLRIE